MSHIKNTNTKHRFSVGKSTNKLFSGPLAGDIPVDR